jgi:hypothetical protein
MICMVIDDLGAPLVWGCWVACSSTQCDAQRRALSPTQFFSKEKIAIQPTANFIERGFVEIIGESVVERRNYAK